VPRLWITYTATARNGIAPFRPNHAVPADQYVLDGDWLIFTSESPDGAPHRVLQIRNQDVAHIEWIEDSDAEQRSRVESEAYRSASRLIPRKIIMGREADDPPAPAKKDLI